MKEENRLEDLAFPVPNLRRRWYSLEQKGGKPETDFKSTFLQNMKLVPCDHCHMQVLELRTNKV